MQALDMRSRQKDINRVDAELERRAQEIRELQSRLQDAEKILVRNSTIWSFLLCTRERVGRMEGVMERGRETDREG